MFLLQNQLYSIIRGDEKKTISHRALVLTTCLMPFKTPCAHGHSPGKASYWFDLITVIFGHGIRDQGWNPCPLQWKCGSLAPGLPGRSLILKVEMQAGAFFHIILSSGVASSSDGVLSERMTLVYHFQVCIPLVACFWRKEAGMWILAPALLWSTV